MGNVEIEIWQDIPEYKGLYQISNLGRIKSLSRKMWNGFNFWQSKERILKSTLDRKGYYKIILCNENGHKTHRIHRLIAQAFIENIHNKPIVNHINGITTDNSIKNLEWATVQENNQHAQDNLLNKARFSQRQKMSVKELNLKNRKITIEEAKAIRDLRKETNYGGHKISKILNIPKTIVDGIIYRETYKEAI